MSLSVVIGAIVASIAAMIGAFVAGNRSANRKRDADQSKAALETYRKSQEAQDEIGSANDDYVTRWLRKRSSK